jgi:hypothetical protein
MTKTEQFLAGQAASAGATVPVYVSIGQWCKLTSMSRRATYDEIGRGNLLARKIGAKTVIDYPKGLSWLHSLPLAKIRPPARRAEAEPPEAA